MFKKIIQTLGVAFLFGLFALSSMAQPAALLAKAKAGDAEAQYQIANLYRKGETVPVDMSKHFEYLQMAANQGHFKAIGDMGLVYMIGQVVSKDMPFAYSLVSIAGSLAEDKRLYQKNSAMMEQSMTQAQIAEGKRIASNWRVGQPINREVMIAGAAPAPLPVASASRPQITGIGDLKLGMSEQQFLALPQTERGMRDRIVPDKITQPADDVRVYKSRVDLGIANAFLSTSYSIDVFFYKDELVKIVVDTNFVPRERFEETLVAKYGTPSITSSVKHDSCVNRQGNFFDWKIGKLTGEWKTGQTRGLLFSDFGNCAVKDANYTVEHIAKAALMSQAIDSLKKEGLIRNSAL